MAQITRTFHKIFGLTGTSDNFGKFGSAKAGAAITTKDLTTIVANSAWSTGLQDAVVGGNKAIALEEMNGLMYVHSVQMGYLFQSGIPEYNAATTYFIGSVVRVGAYWYTSLTDNNTGNQPPVAASDANWNWENQKSALPGDSIPWNGLDVRPGCLWEDGQAYDRATYPALFAAITSTRNGLTTNSSAVVTAIGSTARLGVGMAMEGAGIQAGAVIVSVDSSTQVTMSLPATASATVPILFAPFGLPNSTQFYVPDSRGRGLIGPDNMGVGAANRITAAAAKRLGGAAGVEAVTLSAAQSGLRDHVHTYDWAPPSGSGSSTGATRGNITTVNTSGVSGGALPASASHDNMSPYRTTNWVIKY